MTAGFAGVPSDVVSPGAPIRCAVRPPSPGSTQPPHWSVAFHGVPVVVDGELGLRTVAGGDLLAGARWLGEQRRSVDEQVPVPFGRFRTATNRYREVRHRFESAGGERIDVVVRAYADAVAFRYELPAVEGRDPAVVIADETTSMVIAGNPTAHAQFLENHTTSHEHEVRAVPYRELPAGALLDLPLTFELPSGAYVAVTEAALRRYAGLALARADAAEPPRLVARLTPRPDGTKVVGRRPLATPWRVVMLADRPGALLESETIFCLNDPPAAGDWSWIRPGKITFPWWNGDVFDGQPGAPILSFGMARRYIDFCAANGIPTHAMTSTEGTVTPWYHQSQPGVAPGPDTDVTRPRAEFDLPAIRRYAESRGVRLWTWVHQAALRGRVEEAFAAFERMGWSGMMVDFFDHDDEAAVEFAEEILAAAARHRIMIHLHGVWKPTGLERTYPNLMNHEGALNLEYLKWSDRCTPAHDLDMAFTRLIAGPMDYHLGGFRAVPRAAFTPRNVAPHVLGTRGHQLAMYVCFDNPNPMVADYPTAYVGQAGFEFVCRVPTWWDETRVIEGTLGKRLVTARRRDAIWYVGGLAAGAADTVAVPLGFLGRGRYQATLWRDGPEAASNPNDLATERRPVTRRETLRVPVAADGGFVVELQPERP